MSKKTLSAILKANDKHIQELLEGYSNKIMERGSLTEFVPESGFDVQLTMNTCVGADNAEALKLTIDIGSDDAISIDEEDIETLADAVSDGLKEALADSFEKIGIDLADSLYQTVVSNNGNPLA